MQPKHARLVFITSLLLLAIVTLDFVKVSAQKVEEPPSKTDLTQAVETIGSVLSEGSSPSYFYKFYLKDSAAQNTTGSSESTKNSSALTGATIKIVNQDSFHCGSGGTDFTWSSGEDGLYKILCQESGTMQIRISKSGYNTKTVSLAVYSGDISTIYLTKYVPPPPPPPPETIKDVSLPPVFKVGESTDLSKITDPAKVENLTIDSDNGKIKFSEVVDLSSTDTKDKFKTLDKYIDTSKVGVLSLDSVSLPSLNKKASISLKNLNYLKTPKILVDGKEDPTVVTNVKYENGVATFDTTHFSTFTVVPEVEITEPLNGFETNKKEITLKGSVSDPVASVSAKLNQKDLGKLNVATASGEFSKKIELEEGDNTITLTALASTGATAVATVSGKFLKAAYEGNMLVYIVLFILALIAGFGIIKSAKKMWLKRNNPQPKLPL